MTKIKGTNMYKEIDFKRNQPEIECTRIRCCYCRAKDNICGQSKIVKSPRPTSDEDCPLYREQKYTFEMEIIDLILDEYPKLWEKYDFDARYYMADRVYDLIIHWIDKHDYVHIDEVPEVAKEMGY